MTISAPQLVRALSAVSRAMAPAAKPTMHGVLLRVYDGTLDVVATNGHWLAVWSTPADGVSDGQIVLHGSAVKAAHAWLRTCGPQEITLDFAARTVSAAISGSMPLPVSTEPFPPYGSVLALTEGDRTCPEAQIGVDARYVADVVASFRAGAPRGAVVVVLSMGLAGPLDPIRVTSTKVPELTVVLMPARIK